MSLHPATIRELRDLAVHTAIEAGALIRRKVGRHGEPRRKAAGDTPASQVVTEVDLASQDLILDRLAPSIREHRLGLLTEERADDGSRFDRDFFWCVDPLDGTLPFTEGRPGYAVSIALLACSGKPVLGVVHDPAAETTFHAIRNGGASRDEGRRQTALAAPTQGHLRWLMDRSMRSLPEFPEVSAAVGRLAASAGFAGVAPTDHAGAALNACWVTTHAPAVYFKLPKRSAGGGSLWDFAASACIVPESGGAAVNAHGEPLDLNPSGSTFMNRQGVLYASTPGLAGALLGELEAIR